MKKIISVFMLSVFILLLTGCSKEKVIQPEISKPYEKPWGSENEMYQVQFVHSLSAFWLLSQI